MRSIFHDPFGDFVKSINAPLQFLTCGIIASETKKCDNAAASPRIDAQFLYTVLIRAIDRFRVVMELTPVGTVFHGMPAPQLVALEDWYLLLKPLWEIKFITMSSGHDDNAVVLNSVYDCISCSGTVYVTMEQPYENVITTMELHEKWGAVALKLFREIIK